VPHSPARPSAYLPVFDFIATKSCCARSRSLFFAACPARHCWVSDAADHQGVKRPGLVMEWRQGASGWEDRVAYAAELRPGQSALVEEWLPAVLLTPT